jgi:hypothetical protein
MSIKKAANRHRHAKRCTVARPMRDHRGTHAVRVRTRTPEQGADLGFLSWGGQDLNLRPTDYEFDPAPSATREIQPRESLTSSFSPQSSPTLRNASQSVAGPMRDTSRAGLAERRASELLYIRTSKRAASW